MADLVVVTFKSQEDARKAMEDVRQLQRDGGIVLDDLEMIECDAAGKIHHVGDVDKSTKAARWAAASWACSSASSSSRSRACCWARSRAA